MKKFREWAVRGEGAMRICLLAGVLLSGLTISGAHAEEDIPIFSLEAADVPKVVILMFKPDRTLLEVTYSKEKQAELAKLTEGTLPRKIRIALNGTVVGERTCTEPATGHSLKVEMASPEAAFEMAKALWKTEPKTEKSAP